LNHAIGNCAWRRRLPAGVEDGTHVNTRTFDDRPVHKILCGIAKTHVAERVSNAEQSVLVLKGKENQN
jgi:hypothetical protein